MAEEAASPKPQLADGIQGDGSEAADRPTGELVSEWRVACSSWLQRSRLLLERGGAKVPAPWTVIELLWSWLVMVLSSSSSMCPLICPGAPVAHAAS